MKKSWKSPEQDMKMSWSSHEQVETAKSWKSHQQVMHKLLNKLNLLGQEEVIKK